MSNRAQLSNPAALAAAAASHNPSSSNSSNNSVVGLHYKIGKKIGEGSCGVIFEGANIIKGVAVAHKFDP